MRTWLPDWWWTLKYGSPLTRAGREMRRSADDRDDPDAWVETGPPAGVGASFERWAAEQEQRSRAEADAGDDTRQRLSKAMGDHFEAERIRARLRTDPERRQT
jgi:hypothetical protein